MRGSASKGGRGVRRNVALGTILCYFIDYLLLHDNSWTINCIFDAYLSQEGEGGGEKEHIYNHPKGGLVPPPKEGL